MKKSSVVLSFLFCLLGSTIALASLGFIPQCTNGPLNIVVVNKGVSECDPQNPDICIYYPEISGGPLGCIDHAIGSSGLKLNSNFSFSFYKKRPKKMSIAYTVYAKGVTKETMLRFSYDHGVVSNNCAEVFGSYASCVVTKSGDMKHPIYTFTISKNQ